MRRSTRLFAALACGVLLLSFTVAAWASAPVAPLSHLAQLAHKAADQGTIRVIVELNVPDIEVDAALSARIKAGPGGPVKQERAAVADAALKSRIAATADHLLSGLDTGGARLLRRYSAFPVLALEVSADGLEALSRTSLVRQVEEDRLAKPLLGDTVDIIGASDSWSSGYTGAGWSVAILDTGILSSHEFFAGKHITEACFSANGDCPNGETTMIGVGAAAHQPGSYTGYDHGTHVAGIAAGKKSDDSLAGVAKDADIIAVQVFSRFDHSAYCSPHENCVLSYDSDQIAALDYVYSLRTTANIAAVNLSLGSGAYSSNCDDANAVYKLAVDQLRDAGIATTAASGNSGYCDTIAQPACISTVISVGATDAADAMTGFSNYQADLLDLFAPGQAVTSSVADSDTSYASWSGTSMATPHVTGAFALLRQKDGVSSVDHLLESLEETGDPVTGHADCGTDGEVLPIVRVRADDAISLLASVPAAPDALVAAVGGADRILLTWNDNATNESGFTVERSTGDNTSFSQIATEGIDATHYTDSAVSEGTLYFYRVRAYNGSGHSDYSGQATAVTLLATPENLEATAVSDSRIDLIWTDNSAAESGFEIERATSEAGGFSRIAEVDADVQRYSDTSGLTASTTYTYRIRSTSPSNASSYSGDTQVTTPTSSRDSDGSSNSGDGGGSGGCFISLIASD